MSENEKQEIVAAVIQEIQATAINSVFELTVDDEGWLCVTVTES